MKKEIVLIGGGGHCRACIDVIEAEGQFRIAGIIDTRPRLHQKILGYEVIGSDEDLSKLAKEYENFFITIGQIKSAEIRKQKFEYLHSLGAKFPQITSPSAHVSQHARVGEGTMIMHQALVNAAADIGKNCIINSKALVEHDAKVGDHCHIATGSIVNGGCRIGDQVFIGSQSVMANDLTIPSHTIVGAGAVVVNPIEQSGVYVGNPAGLLKQVEVLK